MTRRKTLDLEPNMTEAEFRQRRRQKFLTEKYFKLNLIDIARSLANAQTVREEEGLAGRVEPSTEGSSFKSQLKLLRLHYTAGESIESLRPLYADAMKWLVDWHRAYREWIAHLARESADDLRTDGTPLMFGDLGYFQLTMDVVSLGVLLGEGARVREAASLLCSNRGTDMLLEYLLESIVPDPRDIEVFFHEKPYGLLVDAVYTADTSEEACAFVKQYLDGWYKAFEGQPWHNGHLVMTDEYSNYEGYWAFEAAAVCVLRGIDDSSFRDHLLYPKDLADWARAKHSLEKVKHAAGVDSPSGNTSGLRCESGQPCPREGWWFTPAKADSRQHFEQGQAMPAVGGDYGATIWQWDANQNP